MSSKSGYTRKTSDWLGCEKEEHFDADGNKIGETKFEDQKQVHFDSDRNKIGETKREQGIFGDKAVHYDEEGQRIGESKDETGFFGSTQRHFDSSGTEVGSSRKEDYWNWEELSFKSQKTHKGRHFKVRSDEAPLRDPYFYGKDNPRSYTDTGETFSYNTSGFGYVVLVIICVVIFFAAGLIKKEVIKRTWPSYETRTEKVLKLKKEKMEREMPLNVAPIQITKEILPVNVIHENPFGTEMRPIRLSGGEKLYSLSRPKVNYGGPGGTIFVEGRYEKKLIADHTGFPCKGLAVSPDETQIGYFLGTMRGATLRIIDKNGTPIREFTHVFWGLPNFPSWSPDGRLIVFSVQSDDGVSGNDGIYIINIENGEIQRLTKNGSYPVWLPDGKRIAFDSWGTIYTYEIASGNVTKILGQKIPDQ